MGGGGLQAAADAGDHVPFQQLPVVGSQQVVAGHDSHEAAVTGLHYGQFVETPLGEDTAHGVQVVVGRHGGNVITGQLARYQQLVQGVGMHDGVLE